VGGVLDGGLAVTLAGGGWMYLRPPSYICVRLVWYSEDTQFVVCRGLVVT
jgi:hypothetical protein